MRSRLNQYRSILLFGGVLITLAGCGATTAPQASSTATPAASSAPTQTIPAGPGTPSSTGISIATDRNIYAGTDVIRVTVMNHTGATVYAAPGHASCTILTLEMLANGQWQASGAAPCPTQPTSALVQIRPNEPYQGAIRGLELPYRPQPFPAGTYRLVIAYWKAITGAIPSPQDSNAVISPSFTIH